MIEITALASGSTGNAYRVSDGQTPLLLEAGIPIKAIMRGLGYKLSEIQAVLVSHSHMDHAKAAGDVLKAGIEVYMSQPTADALGATGHRVRILEPRAQVQIGSWAVLPFETQHDCPGSMGFLLASGDQKLVYITDSYYVRWRFNSLTHVMVECNYSDDILSANVAAGVVPAVLRDRLLQSHFSLEHVKDFLRANDLSRLEEVWLLHLSDGNSDAERFKREIMQLTGRPVYVAGGTDRLTHI
ncbi:MAG TPA: MBL fold metallo-hydrolase [Pseudomonadaceae bacterium]|nr:MBL fold metallo-hydrolase [Pseudomonadaceae bacterium]